MDDSVSLYYIYVVSSLLRRITGCKLGGTKSFTFSLMPEVKGVLWCNILCLITQT